MPNSTHRRRYAGEECSPSTVEGRRHGIFSPLFWGISWRRLFLLALFLILGTAGAAQGQEEGQSFRIGFSRSLFSDVNENDARASIKGWAKVVAGEYGVDTPPTAQIFETVQEMTIALTEGRIDAMGVLSEEYVRITAEVETDHWFLTKVSGSLYEEYVLLAPENGDIGSPADLKGHRILLHDSARTSLATYWTESLFEDRPPGQHRLETHLNIESVGKISRAVLPVFFGQADACIVANSGFETMTELNPQIGRKLRVIARSGPLIPALLFFRKSFNSPQKEKILRAFRGLHSSSAGRQVLAVFQSEALIEVEESALSDTKNFILKHGNHRE